MDRMRMLGRNISMDMERNHISEDAFAERLGYSVRELRKLLEGKLMIVKSEVERIAECLGETYEALTKERGKEEYQQMFDCMGSFSDEENEDFILDTIDMYIEIKERANEL